jgi:signal transduction histidine kinase
MNSTSDTPVLLLVVDDNETARYGKSRILRQAGFEVIEAGDGLSALRLAEERKPRLVVLDVRLPGLDGWQVCRQIKSNRLTQAVLVLQMSATFVSGDDTVRSLEGGADACLTEPCDPMVLLASIRALLRARHAEDALREVLAREQSLRGAAESANRAKDDFLATLSHELRSPLSAILTWASLMREGKLDEARRERAVEAIERNTRLQLRLVEDLLDVSRIISGKMKLELSLVDLGAVVATGLDNLQSAAAAKHISIDSLVDPRIGTVSGDPSRLQQVVSNLLSNAVKFTPKNGRVTLRVTPVDSCAQIEVADTGIGIDALMLPHIFERFRQVDSSTTRAEGGLGLGLALVRHFVELHGGTVEARSDGLGRGSTFVVRLPPAPPPSSAIYTDKVPALRAKPRQKLPSLAGIRVLVVDDESDGREAVALVLEQCGAQVTTASSVAEATAAWSKTPFDAVVSDIAMPSEDGFVLIERLRGQGNTPALALTGYVSHDDQRRILAAGYDTYLSKPIAAAELGQAVARLVQAEARSQ